MTRIEMGKDQLTPARETVASLLEAARAVQVDPPGTPRRAEAFERLVKQAESYGERWGDLVLEVRGRELCVGDDPVHGDEDEGGFSSLLAASGVRKLTLGSGVAREELDSLVAILARAGHGDEDVVYGLWRAGLWAVTVEADDDSDQLDPEAATAVASFAERLDEVRQRARMPAGGALHAAPPVGRDLVPEAPPPEPLAIDEARSHILDGDDMLRRALEVVRAGLWRAGSTLPPELGGKLFFDLAARALGKQDLPLAADILDRADPTEAPSPALAAGEQLANLVSPVLVRLVPPLYGKYAEARGEEIALSLALRCLGHLDSNGVRSAAEAYADVALQNRRPFRRLLSARGGEALEAVIRLADHPALDVAKDGLAILAVIPLEAARKTLEKFAKDPTTPRERVELVRAAFDHATQLAKKSGARGSAAAPSNAPSRSAMAATLVQNLRDMSRERRLAAARSLAKLGPDPKTYEAVESLVNLPGFPDADEEEQQALLDALVASSPDRATKPLEALAQRTLGLPTCKLARAALESAKRLKGSGVR